LAHNRRLTAKLIEAADALNLTLLTPRDPDKRGGSIMLRLPDSHPAAAVVTALRAQGITTDARSQTLRLSPGNLTTMAGTETLIAALTKLLRP
jgi:selenocysteine lyase/cysteine desulfurase